jgi:hypothetical protein
VLDTVDAAQILSDRAAEERASQNHWAGQIQYGAVANAAAKRAAKALSSTQATYNPRSFHPLISANSTDSSFQAKASEDNADEADGTAQAFCLHSPLAQMSGAVVSRRLLTFT